jgi:hypothetical protein
MFVGYRERLRNNERKDMSALGVIALSAGIAGALDIAVTAGVMKVQGVSIVRLLQFIASGIFGSSAFNGGKRIAGIGMFLHFLIALVVAAIYYAASGSSSFALARPVLFGVLYGIGVHLVMSRIVVPLSRAPRREFSLKAFLTQLVIHVFCVGLPISVVQNYFSR